MVVVSSIKRPNGPLAKQIAHYLHMAKRYSYNEAVCGYSERNVINLEPIDGAYHSVLISDWTMVNCEKCLKHPEYVRWFLFRNPR